MINYFNYVHPYLVLISQFLIRESARSRSPEIGRLVRPHGCRRFGRRSKMTPNERLELTRLGWRDKLERNTSGDDNGKGPLGVFFLI